MTDRLKRLATLRSIQRFLDDAYRIPGTSIGFGWDPIIGLVPGLGDLVTGLLSTAIVVEGYRMRVPWVVLARMLVNVCVDLAIGIVPLLGDAADLFWKANTKNMRLLERHGVDEQPATWKDWFVVTAIVGVVLLMAAVPLYVLYSIVNEINQITGR